MANPYYDHTTYPATGAFGSSSAARAEFDSIETGFAKLVTLSGNGNKLMKVNSGASAHDVSIISDNGTTATVTGALSVTGASAFTGAVTGLTFNGLTITTSTGTLTVTNGKTLSCSNTLTFAGTDGSTLNIGTGGTLGTAAYTASTSYGLVASPLSQFAATTSAQLAGVISDETGSGALVFGTSPTLTTPTIGVATATSINKVSITAPASSATLTIADGKTATISKTLTFTGTDGTTMTFPSTSATIARTDAANTFTGLQTFSTGITSTAASNSFGISTVTDNSSSAALTVTQSGSGDALSVTGSVGVGAATGTTYKVRVGGNFTGSATKVVLSTSGEFQSDVTNGFGFHTGHSSAAASFTMTAMNHFYANGIAIGAGSAVTSQYGFRVHSSMINATNNYGFYSDITSAANRYNFYAAGTAPNYFAGTIASLGSYNDTTASAANTFISSAGAIQRSTSSIKYKTDVETIDDSIVDAFVDRARPVWYRSTCAGDRADWGWYGLIAEEVAEIAPQFVHWGYSGKKTIGTEDSVREVPDTDSPLTPEGVMYDRIVVMLLNKVRRLGDRIAALEAN